VGFGASDKGRRDAKDAKAPKRFIWGPLSHGLFMARLKRDKAVLPRLKRFRKKSPNSKAQG